MLTAVHELEQLHGELDVRHRAAPQLQVELRVLAGWDALAFDARLHAADLADVVLGHRPFVHELLGEGAESPAQCGVARDEPGLGERLALPGQAPLLVVRPEPADRPRQRPLVALGPEPGVDAEGLALRGGRADLLDELRRDLLGVVEVGGALALVHEQHVDVGRVRQLACRRGGPCRSPRTGAVGRSDASAASSDASASTVSSRSVASSRA